MAQKNNTLIKKSNINIRNTIMEMFYKHIWRDEFFLSSWTGELFHISVQSRYLRRVWRYQRDNQHPYIEEEQTTQWPKEKVQKDKQRSTKHTYRTKDRAIRTPLKTVGRLRCSGRVSSFRSTRYTHDHRLHRTTYSQNAALSIMLPYSSGISKLTYTSTREELIVIFQLKKL
jgi:hypothetical protein